MVNINSKEHLFVMVQGKNGPERREVKNTSDTNKIYNKMKDKFETEIRRNKRMESK